MSQPRRLKHAFKILPTASNTSRYSHLSDIPYRDQSLQSTERSLTTNEQTISTLLYFLTGITTSAVTAVVTDAATFGDGNKDNAVVNRRRLEFGKEVAGIKILY